MTVGIAAICEGGRTIVMATDRLVSVSEAGLFMEMERKKLVELVPGVWMAMTGTLQDADYTKDRFSQAAQSVAGQSVFQIAEQVRKASEYICEKQVEDRVVRPALGISYSQFKKACLEKQTTELIKDVYLKAGAHKFDLELMLGGFDGGNARIYRVTFSSVNSHDGLGFTSIGCGRTIAAAMLARYGQTTFCHSLADTTFRIYEAKRASEQTRLVGNTTDILVLRDGCAAQFLSDEALISLAGIYDQRMPETLSPTEVSAIERVLPESLASCTLDPLDSPKPRRRSRRRGRSSSE
jgi:20S proteasome alpha/beta subunit